ncbi:MAG TPA: TetR/AcrR family transcriptional regulator [Leptospiraceae bacterium]|nr:TetR/AcrR family transcriptional regulator [Leptospiraceae bacterium]HMW06707.1 TetR/AcrR family transcriptional regulator [Leptospiraceae bacterium]HMX34630.1 TetR/AcrR family transcriptional regulator [Leptospiraceae bacterium]HMY32013.1 TetR/AcrR family transcriptional regulator [Leptospiraceae bacterium]HMZ66252.1 TetR/AcrR family transcriptional regulator [Leptospiraceae bacterium]
MTAKKKNKKKQVKAGRPFKKSGFTVREDLILAGTELLKTSSLENLSLRQVSAKAGVSHVATYHHFKNKNALLAAIAEKGFEKYFSDYQKELEKTKNDFLGKYKALGITYVRFIMSNRQFARIMFGGSGVDIKSDPKLAAVSRKTYRQLHEIIRLGQKIGAIGEGNARNKTLASWAMIHGIAMLFLEGRIKTKDNQKEMEDLIESVTEYAYLGMRK